MKLPPLKLCWLFFLSLLLLPSVALGFEPSKAFRRLAPFRAGAVGSLPYVARHFSAIYGQTPQQLGGLQPIRPRLGVPSFVSPGQLLHIEYLGHSKAYQRLTAGTSYWLIPSKQASCKTSGCIRLGRIEHHKIKKQHGKVAWVTVTARIPQGAKPGFYDLLHSIPKQSKGADTIPALPKGTSFPLGFYDVPTSGKPASRPARSAALVLPKRKGPAYVKRIRRAVAVIATSPSALNKFTFVHLTDFHLRKGIHKRLKHVIDYLNTLRPRPTFVMLTGDIVEYGNRRELWKQCVKALLRLKLPLFVMIGNHDYYRVHWGQPPRRPGLLREEEGLHEFVRAFHPFLAYRFRLGGYHWLSVDTGSSATKGTWFKMKWVTLQGLGAAQLQDIQTFLKTPAPRGHVLFAHGSPRAHLGHNAKGCGMGRHGVFLKRRVEFEKVLRASYKQRPRPLVFLHGHTHWNDLYGRPVHDKVCRFLRIKRRYPMMGTLPCWYRLPIWRSPLLVSTQAATKHQPLRSGGLLQVGLKFGQGAGASYGFRLVKVKGKIWKNAIYRFYHRTRVIARKHPEGYIDTRAKQSKSLPPCSK
ncbi:MAG: hypothetical protein EP343_22095 [Deltaproteobacteria bacterium]|nr:MAG: hypothetical protein EP343_22095 [Deltaproteobacteria bacterium]